MASVLLPLFVFALASGAVFGIYAAIAYLPGHLERRRIETRLREVGTVLPDEEGSGSIVKQLAEGPLPALDRIAGQTSYGSALGRLIEQSGTHVTVSSVLLAAIALGLMCGVACSVVFHTPWAPIPAALVGGVTPLVFLRHRRNRRLSRFEEQFPEALDLLSRAIRAGHAFQTAMGMVAEENMDPIGPEFKKTFDQQNYGLPLKDALNAMTERVPLIDVRFFVTAVLIQRETGGNLAEILDNLAFVVRERFKILRQVRVYTAHGRFTGYVLMALPACLSVALMFINPDHMNLLFKEQMGQMMLGVAVIMQFIGYIWIRQVIKIEV
jgi:tight adherence protein B